VPRLPCSKTKEPEAAAPYDGTQLWPDAECEEVAATEVPHTYPEGGRDAWLVVLGAWCGLTASLGIYNTAGVFEVVISQVILPQDSASTLGWLFSTYAFVNWICGVQVGPTFDAIGPRPLIIAGTVCTLVGIFTLSLCTGKALLLHKSVVMISAIGR
jgi:MFS family permease